MGILSDIVDVVAGGALGAASAANKAGAAFTGDKTVAGVLAQQAKYKAADEARFFSRAFDSVARKARENVLLFPLVVSDGVSVPVATMLGKAIQLRSAEYVRLAVANMDSAPVEAGTEKTQLVSALRGSSLSDSRFVEAVNLHLARNLAETVAAAASYPARLAPPMGRLRESEEDDDWDDRAYRAMNGFAGDDGDDGGGGGGPPPLGSKFGPEERERAYANFKGLRDKDGGGAGGKPPPKPPTTFGAPGPGAPPGTYDPRTGTYDAGANYKMAPDLLKMNQFMPVTLELDFKYRAALPDGKGFADEAVAKVLLAVKSQIHLVPGNDLVEGLGKSAQRDSLFIQVLRLTSGEISLVSDFFLGLKVAKARALPGNTKGSKILEALRRQAEWNNARANWLTQALSPSRGYVPPTSTVVITADEAARIRQRYNLDLNRPDSVRGLLRSHNLMGFGIVDEAVGYVKLFEDGDEDYDRVPFTELAARGKDDSIKDLMTILAKR
jgi:hypothetical protein